MYFEVKSIYCLLNTCFVKLISKIKGSFKIALMTTLFADKDAESIEAFISTSRYLDDPLNINNTSFDGMVKQSYPSEL